MANAYASQADLEVALGGADVLIQLADFDGDHVADSDVVDDYLETGATEVRAAVEVKHEPEAIAALDTASLRLLRDLNATMSAAVAYRKGGRGQVMPIETERAVAKAEDTLDKIASGLRRLGRISGGAAPALAQAVGVMDYDSTATKMSIAGLKRGFR